jgi:hypothetical protein
LLAEKERLETLIVNQKNIIRHDIDELKAEFKKEIKPALDTATFVRRFVIPQKRNQVFLRLGTNVAIDVLFSTFFPRSNILIRTFAPKMIKKYISYLLRGSQPGPRANGQFMKMTDRSY